MKTITLSIEGMMCGHCEKRVKDALCALDGIQECSVSAERNEAIICFDETKLQVQQLVVAIEDVGYDVKKES